MLKKLLLSISLISILHARVIIWDFGGVLFEPNKLGVARNIGLKHFISYMLLDQCNPNVQRLIFDVLALMDKQHYNTKIKTAGTAEGDALPPIMCQWQAGTVTGPEIIRRSRSHIEKLAASGYFISDREKILVKKTIAAMFDPEILAKNIKVVPEGVELLKLCVNEKYKDGRKKHINIGFSNWDPLSFEKFKNVNKEVFKLFDYILISGDMKLIKPNKDAYDHLIAKFNLNPFDCVLIDDQEINTQGAGAANIKTIRIKNRNYMKLKNKLINEGIIK